MKSTWRKLEEIIMTTNINIPWEVKLAVEKTETDRQRKQWYDKVKKIVYGKQAVGEYFPDLSEEMARLISNKDIKVVPVRNNANKETGYYAIFNLCEIAGREWSDCITMEVPTEKSRLFCGANIWHLREWVSTSWLRKLGVKRINVM